MSGCLLLLIGAMLYVLGIVLWLFITCCCFLSLFPCLAVVVFICVRRVFSFEASLLALRRLCCVSCFMCLRLLDVSKCLLGGRRVLRISGGRGVRMTVTERAPPRAEARKDRAGPRLPESAASRGGGRAVCESRPAPRAGGGRRAR